LADAALTPFVGFFQRKAVNSGLAGLIVNSVVPHVKIKPKELLTQMEHFYIFEVQKLNVWRRKMKVKPLGDRVMVKLEKSETKSAGGLLIPDTAQEKTQQGTVVEVGPGTEKDPVSVKVGQKVMYDKYAGTQIKVNGEEHLILKMADIIAVVE
jgi:chaperonin GroES